MQILGIREGTSENAVISLALLDHLVERGLDLGRTRLFVIDGSKELRKAVGYVFGDPVSSSAAGATRFAT